MVCFQKANELTLSLPMQIDHAFEGSFETVSRRSTALALHPCGVTLIMPPFFIWVGNKPVASIIASILLLRQPQRPRSLAAQHDLVFAKSTTDRPAGSGCH
jgi:hypothetical protein